MNNPFLFSEDTKLGFQINFNNLYQYFIEDIELNHYDLFKCDKLIRTKISLLADDCMNFYDNNSMNMDDNIIFGLIKSQYHLQFGFSITNYFKDLIEKMNLNFDDYDSLEFYEFCFKMRAQFIENKFYFNNLEFDREEKNFKAFSNSKLLLFINDYSKFHNLNSNFSIFLLGSLFFGEFF